MISRKYLVIALALPVAFAFQNCSEVVFQSANEAKLISKIDTSNLSSFSESNTPGLNTSETSSSSSSTSTETSSSESNYPEVTEIEEIEEIAEIEESEESSASDDSLNYICILEGAGKSHKLHLQQSKLSSDVSTVDVVCTSKSACLDIVSQKFNVLEAKKSGFCGKNKNTVTLSGADILTLLQE